MTHDFNLASQYTLILRNEVFMKAMSRIGSSVISLIADSTEKGSKFDAYAKENNVGAQMEEYANGISHFDGMSGDSYDVSQMIRLLMKEKSLSTAFASGAVSISELKDLGIEEGIITQKTIDALAHMGASNLAAVAALNMK
jgi:hypothetical protein